MYACLLLSARTGATVIFRSAQSGLRRTESCYLKTFRVQYTGAPFGSLYNESMQGSSAFELDQTAVNPTL